MKAISLLLLLVIFAFLNYFSENMTDLKVDNDNVQKIKLADDNIYDNGIEDHTLSNYKISIEYLELEKALKISGSLSWRNNSDSTINEIYFNVPSNGDKKFKYRINFNEIFKTSDWEFVSAESNLFLDSTLVKVFLGNSINPNDTFTLTFEYYIDIDDAELFSESVFLQFEDWYPKVTAFSNGSFEAYSKHKFIKSFSDYSNFNIGIKLPDEFQIAAPNLKLINDSDFITYNCSIENIPSFSWLMFANCINTNLNLEIGEKKLKLNIYTQKGNDNYIERYSNAIEKYLSELEPQFGIPFTALTIIELPQSSNLKSRSYPTILATEFDIISPLNSQKLEYRVASLLAEQYFGNVVVADEYKYAWLSKGISAFIAEKLVRKEFGELYSYFNIAHYYPIKGLHFLSFSDIPLIYTMGNETIPEGARFIDEYYKNSIYGDLSIPSDQFPSTEALRIGSIVKPQIALLTLQKYLGAEVLQNNLANYYNKYKYQHPNADQFIDEIANGCNIESKEFINDLFRSGKKFDYAIKELVKVSDGEYELLIVRNEAGISPVTINIYTNEDTLRFYWDGVENFKSFRFNSSNEVYAAEVDPLRKNILDLNFANNSYVIENKYWGSLSFAARLFFWFQNAFLIIGSVG